MKITISSTEQLVTLNGVPARIWEGRTDSGTPVRCFVTRISPQTHDPVALAAFEAELQECDAPKVEVGAINLRLVL